MGIAAAFMVPHPPLIVPDVGKGEEKKIMDTIHAYHEIGKKDWGTETGYYCCRFPSSDNVCGLFPYFAGNGGIRRFRTVPGGAGEVSDGL